MPPRPSLRSLPILARDTANSYTCLKDSRWLPQAYSFSTSSHHAYPAPAKKKSGSTTVPTKGTRALRIKKKGKPVRDAKPPDIGERKAIRKRIVLSNTNALEVPGLEELNESNMTDAKIMGQVLALPNEIVTSLRSVEAFKVGQGWKFFSRPACLIRKEAVELGKIMKGMEKRPGKADSSLGNDGINNYAGQTLRKLICGERGVGKSVLLLQIIAMALERRWIVVNIPEARDLTIGHTDYAPIPKTSPVQYVQKTYTANLLSQIIKANELILPKFKVTQDHSSLPFQITTGMNLVQLAELGVQNPDISWPIFTALWKELTAPNAQRPPILLAIDNVSHIFADTHYKTTDVSGKLNPIHAHDFVQIKHFIDHLSGERTLPNGGLVVASTSMSEHAKSPALEVSISMAEARQKLGKAETSSSTSSSTTTTPLSTEDEVHIAQFWSPYMKIDQRGIEALKSVDLMRLQGFTREEARRIMEYWATSGMVRKKIEDVYVTESWTLSGHGVVGELEKKVVRSGRS